MRNAASLYATTVATSVVGFLFWLVAARLLPAATLGVSSAVQAAATLVSVASVLGLSTLVISELARDKADARSLIFTASAVAGLTGSVVSVAVCIVTMVIAPAIRTALPGMTVAVVFVLLSALGAMALVLDDACIGLLQGTIQLRRNVVFSVGKLVLLPIAIEVVGKGDRVPILLAWLAGLAGSVIVEIRAIARATTGQSGRLTFRPLVSKSRLMASHHWLNLATYAPHLLFPIVVTALLGATVNAGFTIALLIVSFASIIPIHLSTVLFALAPGDGALLRREARRSMAVCVVVAVAALPIFFAGSRFLPVIFGAQYGPDAVILIILGFTVLPSGVKAHYVAISRVTGRLGQAALLASIGGALEVGFAALGARAQGVRGAAVGILAACIVEAFVFAPRVVATLLRRQPLSSGDVLLEPTPSEAPCSG